MSDKDRHVSIELLEALGFKKQILSDEELMPMAMEISQSIDEMALSMAMVQS